jgi:hypothetical protein
MNTQLYQTLSLRFPRLGEDEFRLCYLKAEEKTENVVAEQIDLWRKSFEENRVTSGMSGRFASAEVWATVAHESNEAARKALLKGSPDLAEAERLAQEAEKARQAAEAKQAELNRLWNEWASLPEKSEAIKLQLAQIANTLTELNPVKLAEDFKRFHRAILNGGRADPFAEAQLAAVIITAPLRKEVLTERQAELEAELAQVRQTNKTLSKRLGRKQDL